MIQLSTTLLFANLLSFFMNILHSNYRCSALILWLNFDTVSYTYSLLSSLRVSEVNVNVFRILPNIYDWSFLASIVNNFQALIKLQVGLIFKKICRPENSSFNEKEALAQVFSFEIYEVFKNAFFTEISRRMPL